MFVAKLVVVFSALIIARVFGRDQLAQNDRAPIATNISFGLEEFNSDKGLVIVASTVDKELVSKSTMYRLYYNVSCNRIWPGASNCTSKSNINDKAGELKLICVVEGIKICYMGQIKYCTISAVIVGENERGLGSPSKKINDYIFNSVPPLPVRQLKVLNITANMVKIGWNQPDCWKMRYMYIINVLEEGKLIKEIQLNQVVTLGPMKYYTVNHLEAFRKYRICVGAKNTVAVYGQSKAVCLDVRMKEGVPSVAPEILHVTLKIDREKAKATIFWKAPPKASLNGKLKGYEIWYADKADLNSWKHVNAKGNKQLMNYTLTHLFASNDYALRVRLVTGGGYLDSEVKNLHFAKQSKSPKGESKKIGLIIGCVVAGFFIVVIVISVIWKLRKRKKSADSNDGDMILDDEEILPRDHYERAEPDLSHLVYCNI